VNTRGKYEGRPLTIVVLLLKTPPCVLLANNGIRRGRKDGNATICDSIP